MSEEQYLKSLPQSVQDDVRELMEENDIGISEAIGEVLDGCDPMERYMMTH